MAPATQTMSLTVNGQPHEAPAGTSVAGLLEQLGLASTACAAEVNKALVPKGRHASHELADGDTVEIVTLVGGG